MEIQIVIEYSITNNYCNLVCDKKFYCRSVTIKNSHGKALCDNNICNGFYKGGFSLPKFFYDRFRAFVVVFAVVESKLILISSAASASTTCMLKISSTLF